jgi:hypothetical protein
VKINGIGQPAIKAVLIFLGEERCTIGFLPKTEAFLPGAQEKYHNKFAVITFLHWESEDEVTCNDSSAVMGKALFRLPKTSKAWNRITNI